MGLFSSSSSLSDIIDTTIASPFIPFLLVLRVFNPAVVESLSTTAAIKCCEVRHASSCGVGL